MSNATSNTCISCYVGTELLLYICAECISSSFQGSVHYQPAVVHECATLHHQTISLRENQDKSKQENKTITLKIVVFFNFFPGESIRKRYEESKDTFQKVRDSAKGVWWELRCLRRAQLGRAHYTGTLTEETAAVYQLTKIIPLT